MYLRQRSVPAHLEKRIRSYYEYMWTMHRGTTKDDVLSDLHSSLKCA